MELMTVKTHEEIRRRLSRLQGLNTLLKMAREGQVNVSLGETHLEAMVADQVRPVLIEYYTQEINALAAGIRKLGVDAPGVPCERQISWPL